MTAILDAARRAYAAGLCLLPTCNDGSKRPDVPSWAPFKEVRPTIEQMRAFDFASRSGFGVVAGVVSGRRECWDFDTNEVFEAFVEAAAACDLGDVVDRLTTGYLDVTPGGGRRIIVTYPADVEMHDVTLASRPGRDDEPKVKTLIELPTFAIVAPSNGATHPSGQPYVRVSGGFDVIASYDADERHALMDLARGFDEMPRREATRPRDPSLSADRPRPGDAYNQCMSWPQILEPAGWVHLFDRGEVAHWRRPGKISGSPSATTNIGGSDLFYPFTSSSAFEAEKSYSKFAVYAVLEHDGDFAQAARALGYGKPSKRSAREFQRPAAPTSATTASWRWLADVQREYVDWLWQSRLARGTLCLWIGDGGLGKSRASNDLVARLTTGASWPDGEAATVGNAIILSAEDSASYTIRPAIEAAGGDLGRVAILDAVQDASGVARTFNLGTDLAALEALLVATEASLVIIDPLSAYFGTALDSYRDTDVRSVLEPIVKLAERRHVAVLGVMHVGKGGDRQARHRALGSVAFVNAARLVFAIGPDPEDDARRLLVPVKANLCREAPTLAFRLEDADGIVRVVWESAPVAGMTADDVLNGKPKTRDADEQDAASVLKSLLDDEEWPLEAKTALDAGRAQGIPERTMRGAARRLGIHIRRLGFGGRGRWLWHRPTGAIDPSATADESAPDPIAAIAVSVSAVAPMGEVAPMEPPKGQPASIAPIRKPQHNTHRSIGAIRESTRARDTADALPLLTSRSAAPFDPRNAFLPDADPLPACLAALTEPDTTDPIGAHDEEER